MSNKLSSTRNAYIAVKAWTITHPGCAFIALVTLVCIIGWISGVVPAPYARWVSTVWGVGMFAVGFTIRGMHGSASRSDYDPTTGRHNYGTGEDGHGPMA
jgi:hypothetical protein